MKKINFFALIGTALVVAVLATSCSKGKLATPRATFKYDNSDAKSIIKLANPDLYKKVYDQKQEPGTITIVKGYHDMSNNCQDDDAICSIIVVTTYPAITVQDSISLYDSDPNLSLAFNAKGQAYLIEAKPEFPTSTEIRTLEIVVDMNGKKTINCVPYY